MKASVEISLYPLEEGYRDRIINFILRMRGYQDLEVRTNGMSTQVFGDYDRIMQMMQLELKDELLHHRCMAVLKIGEGLLRAEDLPSVLK